MKPKPIGSLMTIPFDDVMKKRRALVADGLSFAKSLLDARTQPRATVKSIKFQFGNRIKTRTARAMVRKIINKRRLKHGGSPLREPQS